MVLPGRFVRGSWLRSRKTEKMVAQSNQDGPPVDDPPEWSAHLAGPRTKPGAVNRAGLLNTLLKDALLCMNPVTLSNRFCVSSKIVSEASNCIIQGRRRTAALHESGYDT
jgi:hypothetical protein